VINIPARGWKFTPWVIIGMIVIVGISCSTVTNLFDSPTPSVKKTITLTETFLVTDTPTPVPTTTPTSAPPSPTPTHVPDLPTPTPNDRGDLPAELPVIQSGNLGALERMAQISLSDGDQIIWSPDERAIALFDNNIISLYILDVPGEPIRIEGISPPNFSPDGERMAVIHDGGVASVWDVTSGELSIELGAPALNVLRVGFSNQGCCLAGLTDDNSLVVWDIDTGELLGVLEIPDWVIPVAFAYDLFFSPDDEQLALFREGEALVWNWTLQEEPQVYHWEPPPAGPVHGPSEFSPDWGALAWTDRGTVMIMEIPSGEIIHQYDRQVGAPYDFSSGWEYLVVVGYNDDVVSVWEPYSGELIQALEHPSMVYKFWLSPDEGYLASVTFDGYAALWDMDNDNQVAELSQESLIIDVIHFSEDGSLLAAMSTEGDVHIWNVRHAELVFDIEGEQVEGVDFSPDGTVLVTMLSNGSIKFWETTNGDEMVTVYISDPGEYFSVSFIHDGHILSITTDKSIQLWGIAKNSPLFSQSVPVRPPKPKADSPVLK
jgi:WD40 repeat protein